MSGCDYDYCEYLNRKIGLLIVEMGKVKERCATLEEAVKSNPTVKPHDEKTDRGNQPAPRNDEGACGCGNCLPGHEAGKEDASGEARHGYCESADIIWGDQRLTEHIIRTLRSLSKELCRYDVRGRVHYSLYGYKYTIESDRELL